jgi:hypothetical protein
MTTKHTKGPWAFVECRYPYKDGSKSHIERLIYTERINPQLKDHYPVVGMSIGIGLDGGKAVTFIHIKEEDARLIAAAPDLLEALVICESNISSLLASNHPKVYGEWLTCVRAAIAKATGVKA